MARVSSLFILSLLFSGCGQWDCKDDPTPAPGSGAQVLPSCIYETKCDVKNYCLKLSFDDGVGPFNGEDLDEINKAVIDWGVSLQGVVNFSLKEDCPYLVVKGIRTDSNEAEFRSDKTDLSPELDRGFETGNSFWINKDRTCGVWVLGDTVRHEFGHMLGLKHSDILHPVTEHDVMTENYNPNSPAGVQVNDVLQYEDIHQCCVTRRD